MTEITRLLFQAGLVFELAGAFVLATPGLTRPSLERLAMAGTRLPDVLLWVGAATATLAGVLLAVFTLSRSWPTIMLWLISMAISVCWLPVLVRVVLPGIDDVGKRPTDAERDSLHLTGLSLLAIGFILQALAHAI